MSSFVFIEVSNYSSVLASLIIHARSKQDWKLSVWKVNFGGLPRSGACTTTDFRLPKNIIYLLLRDFYNFHMGYAPHKTLDFHQIKFRKFRNPYLYWYNSSTTKIHNIIWTNKFWSQFYSCQQSWPHLVTTVVSI